MILCPFFLPFHLLPPPRLRDLPLLPPPLPPGYGWEGDDGQSPGCRTPDSLTAVPHFAPEAAGSPQRRLGGG